MCKDKARAGFAIQQWLVRIGRDAGFGNPHRRPNAIQNFAGNLGSLRWRLAYCAAYRDRRCVTAIALYADGHPDSWQVRCIENRGEVGR